MMDFKTINQAALLNLDQLVHEVDPGAQASGREWLFLNPRRSDSHRGSASINRDDGTWKDFGTTEPGGDLVCWWAHCRNLSMGDAGKELAQRFGVSAQGRPEQAWKGPKPVHEYVPMFEALDMPYVAPHGASMVWTYQDEKGRPLYQRPRFEPRQAGEKKQVKWWCIFRAPDGSLEWKNNAPPVPRPLYGLPHLFDSSRYRVLIVEGEKAADAALAKLPAFAVVTSGGKDSAGTTAWAPLHGREDVTLWPDHDQAGLEYAGAVAAKLKPMGIRLRVVDVPMSWPAKWDLADPLPAGVTPAEVQRMIDKAPFWDGHEEPDAPSGQLEVLTWADFKGITVPALEWIWEPFLHRISFGIVASMPTHGKSILSLQLGVAVAAGLSLFGYPTSGPGGVGILALEDDRNSIHRRVCAIVDSYGAEWTSEHDRRLQGNLRIIIRSRLALEQLSGQAQEFHLAGLALELGEKMRSTMDAPMLLFIDTLNAVHDGDENNATEARPFNAAIYSLNAALGCSVWPLHHLRKAGLGKNAPPLEERLSTELIRGSSALLAGARGTAQFGWIVPTEATKANLEPVNCMRRYAIFALTSVNDGPASPWILLEHSSQAGIWIPVHNGDKILATLRGGNAAQELTKAEEILLDVAGGMKHKELAEKYYPDDPKADFKVKTQLNALRSRHKWVQKGSLELTVQGFNKVKELGTQPEILVDPDEVEGDSLRPSA